MNKIEIVDKTAIPQPMSSPRNLTVKAILEKLSQLPAGQAIQCSTDSAKEAKHLGGVLRYYQNRRYRAGTALYPNLRIVCRGPTVFCWLERTSVDSG